MWDATVLDRQRCLFVIRERLSELSIGHLSTETAVVDGKPAILLREQ
jgi:hypothetical protein